MSLGLLTTAEGVVVGRGAAAGGEAVPLRALPAVTAPLPVTAVLDVAWVPAVRGVMRGLGSVEGEEADASIPEDASHGDGPLPPASALGAVAPRGEEGVPLVLADRREDGPVPLPAVLPGAWPQAETAVPHPDVAAEVSVAAEEVVP